MGRKPVRIHLPNLPLPPDPIRSPVANGLHTVIREVNDMRSDVMEILERLEV